MPNKGVVKQNLPDTFYHVYNRVCKEKLFRDESDYSYFYNLIKRYLGQILGLSCKPLFKRFNL
jgi:hypothetical protein